MFHDISLRFLQRLLLEITFFKNLYMYIYTYIYTHKSFFYFQKELLKKSETAGVGSGWGRDGVGVGSRWGRGGVGVRSGWGWGGVGVGSDARELDSEIFCRFQKFARKSRL